MHHISVYDKQEHLEPFCRKRQTDYNVLTLTKDSDKRDHRDCQRCEAIKDEPDVDE